MPYNFSPRKGPIWLGDVVLIDGGRHIPGCFLEGDVMEKIKVYLICPDGEKALSNGRRGNIISEGALVPEAISDRGPATMLCYKPNPKRYPKQEKVPFRKV